MSLDTDVTNVLMGIDTGEDFDVERANEDFEDYKCNGGELDFDEWMSEQIEQAELRIESEMETEMGL